MQYSQKKPYKNFYNKSKTYDHEQLDQESSEGHTFQNNYYKQNNFYKYSKTKKYYNEYNNYQTSPQTDRPNTQGDVIYHQTQAGLGQFDKWQHVIIFKGIIEFNRTNIPTDRKEILKLNEIRELAEMITNSKIKMIKDQIDSYIVQEKNMYRERILNLRPILVRILIKKQRIWE